MEKSQQKKGQKTKQEILVAAANVFIAKGFEGASISDIAAQKGLNQSLIYHYFKDKKALWRAVKEWILADFLTLCEKAVIVPFEKKKFILLLIEQMRYLHAHPDVLRFILWQQLEEKVEVASAKQLEIIQKGVTAWQDQRACILEIDPEVISLFISSLLMGPLQQTCALGSVDIEAYAVALTDKLERAISFTDFASRPAKT